MAAFLTEEWCEELTALLRGSEEFRRAAASVDLTMGQVVDGVPGRGTVRYHLRIDHGEATYSLGEAVDADVTMSQDYETASAIARGELNIQNAFMEGRLKVSGDMGRLLANQAALASIQSLWERLEVEY